jgi:hypothetical protein
MLILLCTTLQAVPAFALKSSIILKTRDIVSQNPLGVITCATSRDNSAHEKHLPYQLSDDLRHCKRRLSPTLLTPSIRALPSNPRASAPQEGRQSGALFPLSEISFFTAKNAPLLRILNGVYMAAPRQKRRGALSGRRPVATTDFSLLSWSCFCFPLKTHHLPCPHSSLSSASHGSTPRACHLPVSSTSRLARNRLDRQHVDQLVKTRFHPMRLRLLSVEGDRDL